MALLDDINKKITSLYNSYPYKYFSEHDIHTDLAKITNELLDSNNELWETTLDGKVVNRIHHEYPTPFRCYMKGTDFKMYTEEEYEATKEVNPSLRLRRGHFDLIVFNPDYISQNKFRVVTGKNYRYLLDSFSHKQPPALDLAIEVVFYLSLDEKPHKGIMDRRVKSSNQDYKKLISLMNFKHDDVTPFCKEAGMMFFANTKHKDLMKQKIRSVKKNEKVEFITHIV
ncbi:MAG: hypothetical protein ACFFDN_22955 [Candidatus Hodarchaeota archaeon]